MIQKIFITFFIISVFLFGIRFLKKINSFKFKNKKKEENIVDLEKDPDTNEYRPKD
tara:strand:- start:928 stop:1095 length:168 start_codon:yes stop_codon:yes gene_type:complete